jgi:hypothetical protein
MPGRAGLHDFGIARHWSRRRHEIAYGRLRQIAGFARTQH